MKRTYLLLILLAPCLHLLAADYDRSTWRHWIDQDGKCMIPRKQVDQMFYRAMRDSGVSWWRAKMMYLAVRAGGGYWEGGE